MILESCLWFSLNCFYYRPIPVVPVYDTKEQVQEYIVKEFDKAGLDSKSALIIANCESTFNVKATHTNKNGSTDGGVWQINSIHKLPDSCRFSLPCSTEWVINKVKRDGGWSAWTCSRRL